VEGSLPDQWELKSLAEISLKLKAGGTPPRDTAEYWNGTIPFVKIDDITVSGGELFGTSEKIDEKGLQESSAWLVPEDTVLLAMYASIGECAINRIPVATNQAIIAIIPKISVVVPEYLAFVLMNKAISLASRNIQTTQKNITKGIVEDFLVPIPPLNQQHAIAETLGSVRSIRQLGRRELALERERKAALVEFLFSHGTRSEAQKDTAVGRIPQSWEIVELGSLIRIGPQNGVYKPQSLYREGTSIIRIEDFDQQGRLLTPTLQRVRISDEEIRLYALAPGDILINRVNSLSHLGKAMVVEELAETTAFESNMMRFSLDETRVSGKYLVGYLTTGRCKAYIRGRAKRAVAQSSINQGDVRSIRVALPTRDEQDEVVEVLSASDEKIHRLEGEISVTDELFAALSQELISGNLSVRPLIPGGPS
jgi:type I restriction enzyme S subunit